MNNTENRSMLDYHDIKMKGTTRWVLKDAEGNIISDVVRDNNILLQIRKPIIKLLGAAQLEKTAMPFVYAIGFGTDGTPPDETQTGLIAPIAGATFKLLAAAPQFDADGLGVTFVVLFDLTDAAVDGITMREACLFAQDGTAIARTTIGECKKLTGLFLEYYHKIRTEINA